MSACALDSGVGTKMIASDLDGTLFGADSYPAPRTAAAVNAIIDAGYIFAAVTGRSHFGGAERVTATGARPHWFIGSNGGHRLNMATSELEERLVFTNDLLDALMTALPEHSGDLGLAFEHEAGFTYDETFRAAFPLAFDGGPRRSTTTWASHDVGKMFVSHPEMTSSELIEVVSRLAPPGVHVSTSGIAFVECTPEGADKALGLDRLCTKLGIAAADVVAFGDNNNDISMLDWAGRGIAMANATPEAKAAANELTATNIEFGVAQVLESLI